MKTPIVHSEVRCGVVLQVGERSTTVMPEGEHDPVRLFYGRFSKVEMVGGIPHFSSGQTMKVHPNDPVIFVRREALWKWAPWKEYHDALASLGVEMPPVGAPDAPVVEPPPLPSSRPARSAENDHLPSAVLAELGHRQVEKFHDRYGAHQAYAEPAVSSSSP